MYAIRSYYASVRKDLEARKNAISFAALERRAARRAAPRTIGTRLGIRPGIIAEIKRASPSKGWIRQDLDALPMDLKAAPLMLQPLLVITSYSIHYTKLYETIGPRLGDRPGIIAEIKRASPSKGWIRRELDAARYAKIYEEAGACAVSTLTEPHFFGGSLSDLEDASSATREVPILRNRITSYNVCYTKLLRPSQGPPVGYDRHR